MSRRLVLRILLLVGILSVTVWLRFPQLKGTDTIWKEGHIASGRVLAASSSGETTLIMGTTDSVESAIDPAQAYDFFGWEIIQNVGCGLVETEPGTGDIMPSLATNWSVSGNGLDWAFTLRQGVYFGDNTTEFNATYVKYSFNRNMGIASPDGPQLNMEYGAIIDNVEVVSKYVVRFNLKIPFGPFLRLMDCPASYIVNPEYAGGWKTDWSVDDIVEYAEGDARASNPMDLGPYILTNWTRVAGKDHEMRLEANPNYWNRGAGLPRTEKIIVKFYADAVSLRLAIEAGDIDVAFRHITATDVEDLKDNPNVKVWQGTGAAIHCMVFQEDTLPDLPQLSDPRIRRALAACLDRQEVVDTVFLGQYSPLYSMIPTGMMGRPAGTDGPFKVLGDANYTYARSLLADLGYDETNKLPIELWYETSGHYPSSPEQAELYKSQFEASGVISVTLKSADWPSYRLNRNEGVMHVFLYGWYPDYIDPDDYAFLYYATWLNHHYAQYNATNDYVAMKAAYDAARASNNETQRIELYNELEDYAVEDCPVVPIWQGVAYAVTKPNIKGVYLDITQTWRMWHLYVCMHDIGIGSVSVSKTIVGQDYSLPINVTIFNCGNNTENFNVTTYVNTTAIHTFTNVTLARRTSIVIAFVWNTTGFVKGNYSIKATADSVPNEIDTSDNMLIDGWVFVTIPGDVDGDRDVDIFDIGCMAEVYGAKEPAPRYNANCDIDGDGDVDIFDIVKAAVNYGESW